MNFQSHKIRSRKEIHTYTNSSNELRILTRNSQNMSRFPKICRQDQLSMLNKGIHKALKAMKYRSK